MIKIKQGNEGKDLQPHLYQHVLDIYLEGDSQSPHIIDYVYKNNPFTITEEEYWNLRAFGINHQFEVISGTVGGKGNGTISYLGNHHFIYQKISSEGETSNPIEGPIGINQLDMIQIF